MIVFIGPRPQSLQKSPFLRRQKRITIMSAAAPGSNTSKAKMHLTYTPSMDEILERIYVEVNEIENFLPVIFEQVMSNIWLKSI